MSDSIEFNVSLNEPVNFNLEVGNQGPKGDKGDTGSKGDTGDRGEKGDPGTTDYNQLQNKPQLDLYLKKSEANTTTADLLNKINQNTDSITDTKNSLRNYALTSDVNGRMSEAKTELNEKISQVETRINDTISQAKTELNGKITEVNNNTSSLDVKFTKLTSDNKTEATQIKANLATTNSVLSTHKELVDKKFTDVNTEQTSQNSLISDILNAFSKESEKGTNLKLNSSATKVLGMTIYGNMAQDKTNGYNLLTLNKTQSSSGVNFTVRDTGYIDAKGTLVNNWTRLPFNEFTLLPGTYTLSREGNSNYAIVIDSNNGGNHTLAKMTSGQTKVTFTVSSTKYGCYIAYLVNKGTNLNISARFMLESGTEVHPYEPSTLGYQNLFDEFSGLPVAVHGAKLENNDGILKLTGKPAVDWLPMITRENINLLDKTEYTIVNYAGNNEQLFVQVVATKKDGTGKDFFGGIRYKTATFTTDSTKYSQYDIKIGLNLASKYPEPVTLFTNVALYKGGFNDDNFPEYSPYASGFVTPRPKAPQIIKELAGGKVSFTGKNLLKFIQRQPLPNSKSIIESDGSITFGGNFSAWWGETLTASSPVFIPAGARCTLSIDKPLPYSLRLAIFGDNGRIEKGEPIIEKGLTSCSFTSPEDINKCHLYLSIAGSNLTQNTPLPETNIKVQLEYGDTATEYAPFETTDFNLPSGINLYKLTDTIYDEVKLENGVAKLIKRVGKLELTGEENDIYPYRTNQAGTISFKYGVSGRRIYTQRQLIADVVCSHFNSVNEDALWGAIENKTGVSIFSHHTEFPAYADKIVFWFKVTDQAYMKITDVASFKNWLKAEKDKGTPVTVYYERRDYTEEQITDPALLERLNKLMEARTYDGLTNISVTGTDLTPEIKVKYMRKIN